MVNHIQFSPVYAEKNNSNPGDLCKKGCGFFGNSQNKGYCSKCFNEIMATKTQAIKLESPCQIHCSPTSPSCDVQVKVDKDEVVTISNVTPFQHYGIVNSPQPSGITSTMDVVRSMSPETFNTDMPSNCVLPETSLETMLLDEVDKTEAKTMEELSTTQGNSRKLSRCAVCNKKMGLTGLSCRCGGVFCSKHRYSDTHNCKFNYQAMGKEDIKKCNPEVVASKVQKI